MEQDERLIHIWLGRDHGGIQKIVVCVPFHPEVSEITCELISEGYTAQSQTATFMDELVRLYEFRFQNLKPNAFYQYRLMANGRSLALGGGLSDSDLHFTYWGSLDENDHVALVSCNGVFSFAGGSAGRWAMWDRMYEEFRVARRRPKLIIHGGDQYYQDEVEARWMERLHREPYETLESEFKKDSLWNALKHFSALSYRKLMAQTVSVTMLDDHDITDGAGGRSDSFEGDEFKREWVLYQKMQLEIFRQLQASRNPMPLVDKTSQAFSFALDLGESMLVALDLRSEKNARKSRLMEPDHLRAVCDAIAHPLRKNVMILIPLIPIRYDLEREATLISMARGIRSIVPNLNPIGKDFLDSLRGVDDDLADVLVSPPNLPTFACLLRSMSVGSRNGVKYTILSGDIHASGSSHVQATVGTQSFEFPVLVSSPIGSRPMPTWLEQVSRERGLIEIRHEDVELKAKNHRFVTRRNFVLIQPSKLTGERVLESTLVFEEGKAGFRDMRLGAKVAGNELQAARTRSLLPKGAAILFAALAVLYLAVRPSEKA